MSPHCNSGSFKERTSAARETSNRKKKHLATVSSHKSCISHNRSGKSLKNSVFTRAAIMNNNSERKMPPYISR